MKTILFILAITVGFISNSYSQIVNVTYDPLKNGVGFIFQPVKNVINPVIAYEYGHYDIGEKVELNKYSVGVSFKMRQHSDEITQTYISLLTNYNYYMDKDLTNISFDIGMFLSHKWFVASIHYDLFYHQGKFGVGVIIN